MIEDTAMTMARNRTATGSPLANVRVSADTAVGIGIGQKLTAGVVGVGICNTSGFPESALQLRRTPVLTQSIDMQYCARRPHA
jgi:hypothetical protein